MTTPFDAPDWRKLSRAELDRGLNNGEAVAGSGEIVAGWERQSADLRKRHADHLDLRYGPRERNRIDFLKVHDDAPTLLFIHGGYWQMRAKEAFTLFAEGPMAHGINVALIGYTLAPDATLDQIVAEIHGGIDFLTGQLPALGGDGKGIVASGWSAGGHLAALALDHPLVAAGLAVSGIYELGPLRDTYINDKLKLTDDEIGALSPLRLPVVQKPLAIAYGSREVAALVDDGRALHARRAAAHAPGALIPVTGADHFTIFSELRSPHGALVRQALALVP